MMALRGDFSEAFTEARAEAFLKPGKGDNIRKMLKLVPPYSTGYKRTEGRTIRLARFYYYFNKV